MSGGITGGIPNFPELNTAENRKKGIGTVIKVGFILLVTAPITSRVLKKVREIRR